MLSPDYITGFVDGEGSFHVAIYKDSHMKYNVKIIPEFHVSQQANSRKVLDGLVASFKCGYVKKNHPKNRKDTTCVFVVRSRDDLSKKVIPFFERHKLQTKKHKDFIIFAKIVRLMSNNRHKSKSGVRQICKLAYSMNQKGKYRRRKLFLETLRD